MNLGYNKMLYKILDKTIIEHTVGLFLKDADCKQILITVSKDDYKQMDSLFSEARKVELVFGGDSRQESIYNALQFVKEDVVLVHDGSRPFATSGIINNCVLLARSGFGAVTAVKPKDTIKERDFLDESSVGATLFRDNLIVVQTPQAFPTKTLKKANELAKCAGRLHLATDDSGLVEEYSDITIKIVEGSYNNLKFTTQEDIDFFEFMLGR